MTATPTPTTLGSHLRRLREMAGLSQDALAGRLTAYIGMQQCILGRWERDELVPDAGQMEALLDALQAGIPDQHRARTLAKERRLRHQPALVRQHPAPA